MSLQILTSRMASATGKAIRLPYPTAVMACKSRGGTFWLQPIVNKQAALWVSPTESPAPAVGDEAAWLRIEDGDAIELGGPSNTTDPIWGLLVWCEVAGDLLISSL